jgi:hypothetical protein
MIVFTFTYDPDTKQAQRFGNVSARAALGILQEIAIAEAVEDYRKENDGRQGQGNSTPDPGAIHTETK